MEAYRMTIRGDALNDEGGDAQPLAFEFGVWTDEGPFAAKVCALIHMREKIEANGATFHNWQTAVNSVYADEG